MKKIPIAKLEAKVGGLSKPSKMPGYAYGLPTSACITGSVLQSIDGSVCSKCYACKGRYVFPNVQKAQRARLENVLTSAEWEASMVALIHARAIEYFRWHDSGDIQSVAHLEKIVNIATKCPDTKFWLPTREQQMVREFLVSGKPIPPNLVIRVSGQMIDGPPPSGFPNTSTVVTHVHQTCRAPDTDNKCADCRQCWDGNVRNVSYRQH